MKITKTLALFALTSFLMVSCKNEKAETTESASTEQSQEQPAQLATASFSIEGMSCAVGCARTIEKKLASTEGIQEAKVDFDKKEATVNFDAAVISTEKIQEIVEKAADGKTYKVSDIKVKA